MTARWKGAVCVSSLVFGTIAVATFRLEAEGERALADAEAALRRGDPDLAVDGARRAAEAYVPGRRRTERAIELMARIARDAEAAHDTKRAFRVWTAVRATLVQTEASGAVPTAWRRTADEAIEHVSALAKEHPDDPRVEADVVAERLRASLPPSGMRLTFVFAAGLTLLASLWSTLEGTPVRRVIAGLGAVAGAGAWFWLAYTS